MTMEKREMSDEVNIVMPPDAPAASHVFPPVQLHSAEERNDPWSELVQSLDKCSCDDISRVSVHK